MLLYGVMSLLILLLLGVLYYRYSEEKMLSEHRLAMQLEGERYLPQLVRWMQGERRTFPNDPAYETAFFLEGKRIGGELSRMPHDFSAGVHRQDGVVYLVIPMGSYGLKAGRTVMMTHDDGLWKRVFWNNALLGGSVLFGVMLGIGFWLSRLFLRPMKEAVELLDHFIKDTTHELNTPVTAILTNIERLDTAALDARSRKKIARIETAASTIGMIYDDLTYLLLGHDTPRKAESFDLGGFVRQRLDYFKTRIEAKQLAVDCRCEAASTVEMAPADAQRLIDNLLSNAIKYSHRQGKIDVIVRDRTLRVANGGAGIAPEKLGKIFGRYIRAEESKGGFGIGLHIVARIAAEYGIDVLAESASGRTVFTLTWPRYTRQSP